MRVRIPYDRSDFVLLIEYDDGSVEEKVVTSVMEAHLYIHKVLRDPRYELVIHEGQEHPPGADTRP